MNGDQTASLVAGLLCLTLVASGLIARRLAWAETVKLALVWAAIFAVIIFFASLFAPRTGSNWVEAIHALPSHPTAIALHNVDYRAF